MKPIISLPVTTGSQIFQYLAMITGTLSIVSCGMTFAWTSPTLPILLDKQSRIPITETEGSWLTVMPLLAAPLGSSSGAFYMNKIGKKKIILLTTIPYFIHWIIIALAPSFTGLCIGRFIGGIANGLTACSLPMYLGEIADPEIRGLLGSSSSVMSILGMWFINVLGVYLDMTTTALIAATVPVIQLLTFVWMPESPYYLILQKKYDKARQSLQTFKGVTDVDSELSRLTQAVNDQMNNKGRLLDIFTVRSNRRAVYIMMGLRGAQHLCGHTAITFYAKIIFQKAGGFSVNMASIIYFSIQLVICCFSSYLVDKTGRRPLLISSTIGCAAALVIEGTYFYIQKFTNINTTDITYAPLVALIIFVIMFNVGLQNIPLLMLSELFPTDVKAFATFLDNFYFNLLAIIVSKFFQVTMDTFGIHVPFFTFTGFALLGLVFIVCFVPETKGQTLEKIQDLLKNKTAIKRSDTKIENSPSSFKYNREGF